MSTNTTSPHYDAGRKETQELLRRWRPIEELKEIYGEWGSVDFLVKYEQSDREQRFGAPKYGYTIGYWLMGFLYCNCDMSSIKEVVGWRPIYTNVTPELSLCVSRRAKEYANGDPIAESEYLIEAHATLRRETRWSVCEGVGHFIAVQKEEDNEYHLFVTAFGDQGIFAQPIRE